MRRFTLAVACAVLAIVPAVQALAADIEVLLIVPRHYGANHFLNLDDYELLGWNVTLAAVETIVPACPVYGGPVGCPPITVDVLVSEITDVSAFDVVALAPASQFSGEPPFEDLVTSAEALDLIQRADTAGLVIYAPCTGPRVLAAAGILDGVTITGHTSFLNEYLAGGADYLPAGVPPVVDGNIVTATRGLYFHEANSEAVARAVEDQRQSKRASGGGR